MSGIRTGFFELMRVEGVGTLPIFPKTLSAPCNYMPGRSTPRAPFHLMLSTLQPRVSLSIIYPAPHPSCISTLAFYSLRPRITHRKSPWTVSFLGRYGKASSRLRYTGVFGYPRRKGLCKATNLKLQLREGDAFAFPRVVHSLNSADQGLSKRTTSEKVRCGGVYGVLNHQNVESAQICFDVASVLQVVPYNMCVLL